MYIADLGRDGKGERCFDDGRPVRRKHRFDTLARIGRIPSCFFAAVHSVHRIYRIDQTRTRRQMVGHGCHLAVLCSVDSGIYRPRHRNVFYVRGKAPKAG